MANVILVMSYVTVIIALFSAMILGVVGEPVTGYLATVGVAMVTGLIAIAMKKE